MIHFCLLVEDGHFKSIYEEHPVKVRDQRDLKIQSIHHPSIQCIHPLKITKYSVIVSRSNRLVDWEFTLQYQIVQATWIYSKAIHGHLHLQLSIYSSTPSTHSIHVSIHSLNQSIDPSIHPLLPSLHPSIHLLNPSTQSIHPSTQSMHSSIHSMHPSTQCIHPPFHPIHPCIHPSTPFIHPIHPSNYSFIRLFQQDWNVRKGQEKRKVIHIYFTLGYLIKPLDDTT